MNTSKNKQNRLIKELIQELEKDGVDVSKYKDKLDKINQNLKDKKYGLVWEQHTEPLIEELKSKVVELQEVKERRIYKGEEYTNNFLIEGDNLESLNAMLKSGLEGKVDVIAIDPPYNIFINKKKSGKLTYEDKRVNLEDSYPHSMWLSFMEERIKLAKKLMSNEGVIFISIDDTEYANLKLLCDEIFGEENFINNFMWLHGKGKKSKQSRTLQQYNLCYAKNILKQKEWSEFVEVNYSKSNVDNDPKGDWFSGSISFNEERSNKSHKNYFKVKSPSGVEWERQWFISLDEFNKYNANGDIYWGNSPQFNNVPRLKIRDTHTKIIPKNIIENCGTTKTASNVLENMSLEFDYPKPYELIKHLISILNKRKDIIVLDFFCGSATTGHSILELNKEDGGNRRFILCTNNENNICEDITYQRLNKVINGYTTPKGKEIEGIPANLTYLKTNLINKENDYIMYDTNHLEYIINLLKLKYGILNEEDLNNSKDIENKLIKLSTESQDIYIYLNDYIDEEDFNNIELDKEKESIIYVDESLVNDKYLLLKGFKNINSVNNYFK